LCPKGSNRLACYITEPCILDGDGGGRGPRTKPTLSLSNEGGGRASDARFIDGPIQTGAEELSSANLKLVIFAERVEFELFRDLELRLDLDPDFDFELSRDVERGEDGGPPFGSVESSCDVPS
jgi:hypothetical protein